MSGHDEEFQEFHPGRSGTGKAQGKTELFDLLRQDHEKARDLFGKMEKTSSKQVEVRQVLFTELERELLRHMEAEERFLFSALEQYDESRP